MPLLRRMGLLRGVQLIRKVDGCVVLSLLKLTLELHDAVISAHALRLNRASRWIPLHHFYFLSALRLVQNRTFNLAFLLFGLLISPADLGRGRRSFRHLDIGANEEIIFESLMEHGSLVLTASCEIYVGVLHHRHAHWLALLRHSRRGRT